MSGDQLVMLGLSGGPKISDSGANPAIALSVNERIYLVDCGYETAKQIVLAGLGFSGLENIFITHNHLDHTSGVPGVILHGWTNLGSTLPPKVSIWGPRPTKRFENLFADVYKEDIDNYLRGGGFGEFPEISGHDLEPGSETIFSVMEDNSVSVTATRVFHGNDIPNSFAYRFDVKASGKSVVFSGDTAAPNENLILLAKDCDYLVHETQDNDNVEKLVSRLSEPRASEIREHLISAHSSVEDLPEVARLANAKNLVLSHYTPIPQDPTVYLQKANAAKDRVGFTGNIFAPKELDRIGL